MIAASDIVGVRELRHYSIDCQPWIREGEIVLSATATVSPDNDEFSVPVIFVQKGRYVTFFAGGTTPDEAYEVNFTIVLSYQRRTLCIRFRVAESCGVEVAL